MAHTAITLIKDKLKIKIDTFKNELHYKIKEKNAHFSVVGLLRSGPQIRAYNQLLLEYLNKISSSLLEETRFHLNNGLLIDESSYAELQNFLIGPEINYAKELLKKIISDNKLNFENIFKSLSLDDNIKIILNENIIEFNKSVIESNKIFREIKQNKSKHKWYIARVIIAAFAIIVTLVTAFKTYIIDIIKWIL